MNRELLNHQKIFAVFTGICIPVFFFGKAFIAVAIGAGVLALLIKPRRLRLTESAGVFSYAPLGLLLIAVFVAWLPNVAVSPEPWKSFTTVSRSFALVFLAFLIWCGLRDDGELRRLCLRSLVLALILTIAFALFSKLVHSGFYWVIHHEPWQATEMKTELKPLAALAPLAIPLLLLSSRDETPVWRLAAYSAAIGLLAVIIVASSRASVAGLLGCMVFALIAVTFRHPGWKSMIASAGFAGVTGAVFMWLKSTRAIPPQAGEWPFPLWLIDYPRQATWQFTIDQVASFPWFGSGVNTINLVRGANEVIPLTNDTHFIPSHPHNWALEILAETGAIGLILFVGLVGTALFHLFKRYRQSGDLAYISVIAISGGYLISGLFNFSFWAAWWQLAFLVFSAMTLAYASTRRPLP